MADPEGGQLQRLGSYRPLRLIGGGGLGNVFMAESDSGQLVALKVAPVAGDAHIRNVLTREREALERVNSPFIPSIIDSDLDAPVPWLAESLVVGPDLDTVVTRFGALPVASVLLLAAGLAHALSAIHAVGIVHRDVKPANVLLAKDGPRLVDFGLALAADAITETEEGMLVGTPAFMSPEQAAGGLVGPSSDIFSLGLVLAFAATGTLPFPGGSSIHEILFRRVQGEGTIDRLPAEVATLVKPCFAIDPAARPTAQDLLASLGPVSLRTDWLPAQMLQEYDSPPSAAFVTIDRRAITVPGLREFESALDDTGRPAEYWKPDASNRVLLLSEHNNQLRYALIHFLESVGLTVLDAHPQGGESLAEVITNAISRADFVVADISQPNPNIYFELGYARGRGVPIILIMNQEDTGRLPFDLAGAQVIFYDEADPRSMQIGVANTVKRLAEHRP